MSVTDLPDSAAMAAPDPAMTELLQRWTHGDAAALDRLLPLVYDELRQLARHHLRQERDGHTLQGTGLVHEAYLRLAQQGPVQWHSRAHFFGWASSLMRHILVDHARARNAAKRGGGQAVLSLDALQEQATGSAYAAALQARAAEEVGWREELDMVALDSALKSLEQLDARQSRVVELRFFGGLSVIETADVLEISVATVKREWSTARAWLLRELRRLDSREQ